MLRQLVLSLAAAVSFAESALEQAGVAPLGTSFASKTIELERFSGTQVRTIRAVHSLDASLELESTSFPVELAKNQLLITVKPGRQERVRDGGELTLHFEEEGLEQARALRFEQAFDGSWLYGPARAEQFVLGGESLYLVDADLDGELGGLQSDGWSSVPGGPLLPLARSFVLGTRHVSLEGVSPGGQLEASVRQVAGTKAQLAALQELNRLRNGVGLLGVGLSSELSVGCTDHARYLVASGWDGASQVREQEPGSPATTRAGRQAAEHGFMVAASGPQAVRAMWDDPRGRIALLATDLGEVGLSDMVEGATVIDAASRTTRRQDPTVRWNDVLLTPCDHGLVGREDRRPLLLARFEVEGELSAPRIRLLRVDAREPREIPIELVAGLETERCTAARPERALKRGGVYLVEHSALISGELWTASARFEVE